MGVNTGRAIRGALAGWAGMTGLVMARPARQASGWPVRPAAFHHGRIGLHLGMS